MWPAVLVAGVYGGYFGAAQGVLLMGIMGVGIPETLQRLNALKNVLAAIVNAVAGLLFVVVADVDWRIVALIGVGSVIGGQLGATVGRRLPGPACCARDRRAWAWSPLRGRSSLSWAGEPAQRRARSAGDAGEHRKSRRRTIEHRRRCV